MGERILIRSFPQVYVPRFSNAIKFHGLDAILDWLAAWHTWPRCHVKVLTAGNWYLRRAVKLLVVATRLKREVKLAAERSTFYFICWRSRL